MVRSALAGSIAGEHASTTLRASRGGGSIAGAAAGGGGGGARARTTRRRGGADVGRARAAAGETRRRGEPRSRGRIRPGNRVGRRRGAAAPRPGRGDDAARNVAREATRGPRSSRGAARVPVGGAGPRARAGACEGAPPPPPGERRHGAARAPGERVSARTTSAARSLRSSSFPTCTVHMGRDARCRPDSRGPERRAPPARAADAAVLSNRVVCTDLASQSSNRAGVAASPSHTEARRVFVRASLPPLHVRSRRPARAFPRASVLETLASLATSAGGDCGRLVPRHHGVRFL